MTEDVKRILHEDLENLKLNNLAMSEAELLTPRDIKHDLMQANAAIMHAITVLLE